VEDILHNALKVADAAEVYYEEGEGSSISFENNKLKAVSTKAHRGVGLRVIRNGRIGFSSTTDFNRKDRLVQNALASAEFGQEAKFEFPSSAQPPQVRIHDKRVTDYPLEGAVAKGRQAIERILSEYPDVKCNIDIGIGRDTTRLLNSAGLDVTYEGTMYSLSISALQVRDEGLVWIGEGSLSRALEGDLLELAGKILQKLSWCRKEIHLGVEKLPVVFTPKCCSELLACFLMGANGKLVQKGASPLCGKLGEKLLDERISIFDDSTVDYAPGSAPVDGEGLPARRMPLYENGVLKNYIFDLQTAGMMNAKPTGNATRGFSTQPAPGNNNIIVSTGGMSMEQMIADMKRGVLVDQLLGSGQSNTLAGEFSVNIELGFLVENGEIVGRVKDCMAAGNAFELMKRVIDIGSEAEWHGAAKLPAIYLDAVSIAGKQKE